MAYARVPTVRDILNQAQKPRPWFEAITEPAEPCPRHGLMVPHPYPDEDQKEEGSERRVDDPVRVRYPSSKLIHWAWPVRIAFGESSFKTICRRVPTWNTSAAPTEEPVNCSGCRAGWWGRT